MYHVASLSDGLVATGHERLAAEIAVNHLQNMLAVHRATETVWENYAPEAAERGDIQTALMMGGNLLASNPDTDWAAKALAAIDTRIFLTTTLNRGHVADLGRGEVLVLPVTARDEEWQRESAFALRDAREGRGVEGWVSELPPSIGNWAPRSA